MGKLMQFLERFIMPLAGKIAAQKHLCALRDGMILAMPLLIIGSFFLILANIPIDSYLEYMKANPDIKNAILYPYRGTFDLVTIIATFGIAYRLSENYKVDPLAGGSIALASYFVITPFTTFMVNDAAVTAMEAAYFTSKGLFVGMLVAILTTEIYRYIVQKDIVIKMPDGVPPAVSKSFTALIPAFVAILVVYLLRLLIENVGDFGSIHNIMTKLLQEPLTQVGTSFWGTMFIFFLIVLFWTTGLHGASIIGAIMTPIWLNLSAENATSLQNGEVVKHIATNEFNDMVFIGGSGTTLGLVIAMLLFAKSEQMKKLGRLSIGPGIFNINEPVLFGMPIVMNPLMIVPFILAPLASVALTYISMDMGIVAKPIGIVPPWTMPPILQGYIVTGSVSGALLQVVIIVMTFLIYFPFFKIWDKQKLAEETK